MAIDIVAMFDILAVLAGGIAPAAFYTMSGLPVDWARHLQICLVSAGVVYLVLKNEGMYDPNRIHSIPIAPKVIARALCIALLAVVGLGLPFVPNQMHLLVWYSVWLAISWKLLVDVRCAARSILKRLTATGKFDNRIAVYGSGTIACRVHNDLLDERLGIKFSGLYDDRRDAARIDQDGPAIKGKLSDLIEDARSGEIDSIIIALPQSADQRLEHISSQLEHLPVAIHIVTHLSSDILPRTKIHKVSSLGSIGLIDVKTKPLPGWSRVVKGLEDLILAPAVLILALPLLACISIAIKLDSPGPIFFRQRRTGFNQRVFEVLKFRTMHVLEDGAGVKQATKSDPRITRVGRILRRTSLDELPQLFNVMRGEMSLVGPRPHAIAHDEHFSEILARYVNRQQVKPGITGLAQISGLRGETETIDKMERRLAKDLEYVETWSLGLDLKILGQTLIRGWHDKNAY